MSAPIAATVDFETEAIGNRPSRYPPKPVGVAIDLPGMKPFYLAWGHPTGNNCTQETARRYLSHIWKQGNGKIVFHNGKFDYEVGTTHLGLPKLNWHQIEDTLYLIFLQDPDRSTLSLKPVAAQALNLPATERDDVRDWLIANGIVKRNDKKWGAHIAKAPGGIVGRYAVGDVVRTRMLYEKYYKEVCIKRGMLGAYDRERELMPILLESEQRGIGVDLAALRKDVPAFERAINDADDWIRKRLRTKDLNVDSNEELCDAILKCKKGDLTKWPRTDSGQLSASKVALETALKDRELFAVLMYRGTMATCTRTFLRPYLDQAEETGGVIHTSWNQVAQDYHSSGAKKGARTGRLSSSPNFQNIPTDLQKKLGTALQLLEKLLASGLVPKTLVPIPMVRRYITPSRRGRVLLNRDYSQQELRILAHFEDDVLLDAYRKDQWTDMHDFVQGVISDILGLKIDRKPIKVLNFGLIYGMGIGKLAEDMGLDVDTANKIKRAHQRGFPGVKELQDQLRERADMDQPIRTWGGREYYCEEPKTITKGRHKGKTMSFEYKLLNRLVQGSAADNTKQAMINYHNTPGREGDLLLNVHDELMAECDEGVRVPEMRRLRDAMADVKFDVPMLSEGRWSKKNWYELQDLPKGE